MMDTTVEFLTFPTEESADPKVRDIEEAGTSGLEIILIVNDKKNREYGFDERRALERIRLASLLLYPQKRCCDGKYFLLEADII